jgi:hypothetical protein
MEYMAVSQGGQGGRHCSTVQKRRPVLFGKVRETRKAVTSGTLESDTTENPFSKALSMGIATLARLQTL